MKPTLRIVNATRGSILSTHADIARDPETRRWGLLGMTADQFPPGAGLFFPECNAIHTLEMSMTIDVLFFDMLKMRVVKTVQELDPGCHVAAFIPAPLCAVLELPAGVIRASGTQPGDVVRIMSSGHEPVLASSYSRLQQ